MDSTDLAEKARSLKGTEEGQLFYFITSAMTVEVSEFKGTDVDNRKFQARNFFPTKQKAEQYRDKIVKFLIEKNP